MTEEKARELTKRLAACGVDLHGWGACDAAGRKWNTANRELYGATARLDFNDDGANLGRLAKVGRERWKLPGLTSCCYQQGGEVWWGLIEDNIDQLFVYAGGEPFDGETFRSIRGDTEEEAWVDAIESAPKEEG